MHSTPLRGWVGGVWVLRKYLLSWRPLLRRILLHSIAVVVLCSGSGSGHPRDQFKLFCDKRPQITSTLIAPLFSLSGARIYISKNWLSSSFKGSFFNWASLRESWVVARVWSGFKARGLNVIIIAIRNEDQSWVLKDIKWQLNIPNLIAYHPWLEKELDDDESTIYHSKNKN